MRHGKSRDPGDTDLKIIWYPYFQDGGIPYRGNWNWASYITNTDRDPENFTVVTKDYFPTKGPVKPKDTNRHIKHQRSLGHRNLNATEVKAKISLDLKKCKQTLASWFSLFYVQFARHAGIFYTDPRGGEPRNIQSFKELEYISKHLTEDELINFYCFLYFPFDYMGDYIGIISENLMIQHRLTFDQQLLNQETNDIILSNGASRTRKSCFGILVSIVLNALRKKIRDKCKNQYLLEFTLKNNTKDENMPSNIKRTLHRKKYMLHTWMLKGEFVSS